MIEKAARAAILVAAGLCAGMVGYVIGYNQASQPKYAEIKPCEVGEYFVWIDGGGFMCRKFCNHFVNGEPSCAAQ